MTSCCKPLKVLFFQVQIGVQTDRWVVKWPALLDMSHPPLTLPSDSTRYTLLFCWHHWTSTTFPPHTLLHFTSFNILFIKKLLQVMPLPFLLCLSLAHGQIWFVFSMENANTPWHDFSCIVLICKSHSSVPSNNVKTKSL